MTEDFLHYLWKYRLIAPFQELSNGDQLEILDPGTHNKHAGPDFLYARVRIGALAWAGNIEFHVHSSDWYRHEHHHDHSYENVILHVVFIQDGIVKVKGGKEIPTLVLKDRIDMNLFGTYQQLMLNRNWIPCSHLMQSVSPLLVQSCLDRVVVERFDRKAAEIAARMKHSVNDWNETFYQTLAVNFGFKVNAVPFELLSKSLPLSLVKKHVDNPFQLEALYFGQAGLLKVYSRIKFYHELRKEYKFLAAKYQLRPIDGHLWKFMRMRPANFPTIRISQFASLMASPEFLFSKILRTTGIKEMQELLTASASAFWNSHYTFTKRSANKNKVMGMSSIRLIMINTVVPFLYAYGKIKNMDEYRHQALGLFENIPGEKNSIIRHWTELGMPVGRATDTQALLELYSIYCKRKKCLNCMLGLSIIKSGHE